MSRNVAYLVSFFIFTFFFASVLININGASGYVGKIKNVRVCFSEVSCGSYHKFTVILVKKNFFAASKSAGGSESGNFFLVRFAVIKLLLNFRNGGLSSFGEPRRKFFLAIAAHYAVFKFFLSENAKFLSAESTVFFFKKFSKKSHN